MLAGMSIFIFSFHVNVTKNTSFGRKNNLKFRKIILNYKSYKYNKISQSICDRLLFVSTMIQIDTNSIVYGDHDILLYLR